MILNLHEHLENLTKEGRARERTTEGHIPGGNFLRVARGGVPQGDWGSESFYNTLGSYIRTMTVTNLSKYFEENLSIKAICCLKFLSPVAYRVSWCERVRDAPWGGDWIKRHLRGLLRATRRRRVHSPLHKRAQSKVHSSFRRREKNLSRSTGFYTRFRPKNTSKISTNWSTALPGGGVAARVGVATRVKTRAPRFICYTLSGGSSVEPKLNSEVKSSQLNSEVKSTRSQVKSYP